MGPREPVGTHSANFLLTVFVLNLEKEEKNPFMLLVKVFTMPWAFFKQFFIILANESFPMSFIYAYLQKKTFTELINWC